MADTNSKGSRLEKNYRAVLIREETKEQLRGFRRGLEDREIYQERRLATAALEIVLENEQMHKTLLSRATEVMRRETTEL